MKEENTFKDGINYVIRMVNKKASKLNLEDPKHKFLKNYLDCFERELEQVKEHGESVFDKINGYINNAPKENGVTVLDDNYITFLEELGFKIAKP